MNVRAMQACGREVGRLSTAAALVLAIVTAAANVAWSEPIARYVSPAGDDANPGTMGLPFATIQHAVNASADGDSVMLADGEYSGPGNRDIDMQGKAIRVASISMEPELCVINCADPDSTPHIGFIFSGNYNDQPVLAGVTVTGATTDEWNRGAILLPLGGSAVGASSTHGSTDASEQEMAAIYGMAPILRNVRVENNRGDGFFVDSSRTGFTAYDCSFSNNTGNGGATSGTSVSGDFFDCRFNGNGGSGLVHGGVRWSGPVYAQIQRCQFNGNGMDGYSSGACITARGIEFDGCEFIGNIGNGIFDAYGARVTSSVIADNGGWGLVYRIMVADPSFDTLIECEVLRNQDGGIWCDSRGAHCRGGVSVSGCLVADNGGPGIVGAMGCSPGSIRDSVISGNLGPAIILNSIIPDDYWQPVQSQFVIEGNTIVESTGPGLHCRFGTGYTPGRDTLKLSLLNSIICRQDTAATFDGFQPDSLLVACTDIFGNTTGDWTGPLAPFANQNGNLSVDPLFCADANPSDPWTLHADSPLAAENNVDCGQIGARGAACASTVVACRSIHVYDPVTGAYDPAQLNRVVTVEGVVYVAPGTYSETGGGYLQDESGGINFWRSPVPEDIHVGDRVRITGPIWPWLGELHIGPYSYAKLDSQFVIEPIDLSIEALLDDFSNTGSHVMVAGTITDLAPDTFRLVDGPHSIQVRRNLYGNVSFDRLTEGSACSVTSPCFMEEGMLYLMPPSQSSIEQSNLRFVALAGDDTWPGTRARPYETIQRAVNAATSGDTIIILEGLYTGPGNARITWDDKNLAIRSDGRDRSTCIIDCAGVNGFSFRDTNGADQHSISFDGISIINADTAICVAPGYMYAYPLVQLSVSDCAVRNGNVGIRAHGARLSMSRTSLIGNAVAGVAGGWVIHLAICDCTIRDNGTGIGFSQMSSGGGISISRTEVVKNGVGLAYWQETGGVAIRQCRFDSSTVGDGIRTGSDFEGLLLEDCSASGNARHGVAVTQGTALNATRCVIGGNGAHGIATGGYDYFAIRLDDVMVAGNMGWGLGRYIWQAGEAPHPSPEIRDPAKRDPPVYFEVRNSEVISNGQGGVHVLGALRPIMFENTTIVNNAGVGLHLDQYYLDAACSVSNSTIASNSGTGILARPFNWTSSRTIVAHNGGAAIELVDASTVNLSCTDIFGNLGGDWTGAIAGQSGENGNLNVEPRFCDATKGDYHLQQGSPLSSENGGNCGTIGRYDWNCPAQPLVPFEPDLADVPDDQGGALRVTWLRHLGDAAFSPTPITTYDLQRWAANEWQTITSLAAAAADTYTTVITTPDVLTAGQPIPWSRYRLVARTATPAVFFESPVDSAYSIDDLAPPKPAAVLVDGVDFRHIVWPQPGIPDLASACVFRGTESGFTPGTPLECPEEFFTESHLAWYFYRVQFTDTHGNLSEFSDELHGQFPTGVGDLPATKLAVSQNVPNPFNPFTTIRFNLPAPSPVTASVFDLSGRLVRTLLSGAALGAGPHDLTWDGRDDAGRHAPSGGYHFRLEAAGESRAVRMLLLK